MVLCVCCFQTCLLVSWFSPEKRPLCCFPHVVIKLSILLGAQDLICLFLLGSCCCCSTCWFNLGFPWWLLCLRVWKLETRVVPSQMGELADCPHCTLLKKNLPNSWLFTLNLRVSKNSCSKSVAVWFRRLFSGLEHHHVRTCHCNGARTPAKVIGPAADSVLPSVVAASSVASPQWQLTCEDGLYCFVKLEELSLLWKLDCQRTGSIVFNGGRLHVALWS